jgi:hypothetical protein
MLLPKTKIDQVGGDLDQIPQRAQDEPSAVLSRRGLAAGAAEFYTSARSVHVSRASFSGLIDMMQSEDVGNLSLRGDAEAIQRDLVILFNA